MQRAHDPRPRLHGRRQTSVVVDRSREAKRNAFARPFPRPGLARLGVRSLYEGTVSILNSTPSKRSRLTLMSRIIVPRCRQGAICHRPQEAPPDGHRRQQRQAHTGNVRPLVVTTRFSTSITVEAAGNARQSWARAILAVSYHRFHRDMACAADETRRNLGADPDSGTGRTAPRPSSWA